MSYRENEIITKILIDHYDDYYQGTTFKQQKDTNSLDRKQVLTMMLKELTASGFQPKPLKSIENRIKDNLKIARRLMREYAKTKKNTDNPHLLYDMGMNAPRHIQNLIALLREKSKISGSIEDGDGMSDTVDMDSASMIRNLFSFDESVKTEPMDMFMGTSSSTPPIVDQPKM
ncbi:unnamed protein product [Caenorhabditis bovis]|nr:unnamed protein product [Caenorhabditis bovis]